jgi:hypothetical protein
MNKEKSRILLEEFGIFIFFIDFSNGLPSIDFHGLVGSCKCLSKNCLASSRCMIPDSFGFKGPVIPRSDVTGEYIYAMKKSK